MAAITAIAAALLLGVSGMPCTAYYTTRAVDPAVSPVVAIGPVVDAPAPVLWDVERNRRVGASAYRFELDDPSRAPDLSAYYHLAYVPGGERLQVFEHNPATTQGPQSRIATTQNVAWQLATALTDGHSNGLARPGDLPDWARPRTGNVNGRSGGLLWALADIDLLTPGSLAGDLRVAATGAIYSNGVITRVLHVDAKLAAARHAHPDVFFSPHISPGNGAITTVASRQGTPTPDRTIGDWLNTAGYEDAGRLAATLPDTLALVIVDDIRQALAWLCGRTNNLATCTVANTAAAVPLTHNQTTTTPTDPTSDDVAHPL